jgi:hypothetical protein
MVRWRAADDLDAIEASNVASQGEFSRGDESGWALRDTESKRQKLAVEIHKMTWTDLPYEMYAEAIIRRSSSLSG